MPASNAKLFVAAAALNVLGENYKFHTTLLSDAPPSADTIKGSVYLRGGGDPLLSSDDIRAFVKQLLDSGVKHITGDVVGDGSLFTDGPYPNGWSWDYLSDDYAPEISGLEVEEGVIQAAVAPGKKIGDSPSVMLRPATGYIPIDNHAKTAAANAPLTLEISRPYDKNVLEITGDVPLGYSMTKPVGVGVDNPALYAATLLMEDLLASGITVDGEVKTGATPSSATPLYTHDSAPLSQYLPAMLKPSDNLMAECLVRILGVEKGKGGSFSGGYAVELAYLRKIGITDNDVVLADGSGVSRLDMVSPAAVVKLLTAEAMQPNFKIYYDALPIAGIDGTLRRRMVGSPAQGNVHAKTGTLRFAHTLSGYVSDADANILAFSILNNNFLADSSIINQFQDAVAARLAREHAIGIVPVVPSRPATRKTAARPAPRQKAAVSTKKLAPAIKPAATTATRPVPPRAQSRPAPARPAPSPTTIPSETAAPKGQSHLTSPKLGSAALTAKPATKPTASHVSKAAKPAAEALDKSAYLCAHMIKRPQPSADVTPATPPVLAMPSSMRIAPASGTPAAAPQSATVTSPVEQASH